MTTSAATFRMLAALAILATGIAWSPHGASQTPVANDAQSRLIKRFNAFVFGRISEYIADVEIEKARNPSFSATSSRTVALAYDAVGNAAAALAEIDRAYQLPGAAKADLAFSGQLVAMGIRDQEKLVYWLTERGKLNPAQKPELDLAISRLDKPAEALAALRGTLHNADTTEAQHGNLAPWLAYHGDHEGALEALRLEKMAVGPQGGTPLWLSLYREVRNLPGFRQLVWDTGLVEQWRKTGWGDYCKPAGKNDYTCGTARTASGKPVTWRLDQWQQVGPHRTRRVPVDRDVNLEVVDWGGTGRPLVLLAGLGNTAHIFDALASQLTDRYHVYGITRRGYGVSSAPDTGYDADQLGDDVLAVIKALNLRKPVLAGHSLAGEELSSIGSRHPEQVAGLIYLDAHYSYAFHDKTVEELIEAYTAARAVPQTTPPPPRTPPELIAEKIVKGAQQYTKVEPPVLAIMAGQQGMPNAADPAIVEAQKKAIRVAAPSARIIYIPQAHHYIYGSHQADVLAEMRAFIASLE